MSDAIFWATVTSGIFAGAASGLLVGVVSGAVRAWFDSRRATRARRKRIMSLLAEARMLAFRALRDGLYENKYFKRGDPGAFELFRKEYDDLTVAALGLFEAGEGDVARWTEIEFYAGFHDYFYFVKEQKIKRNKDGSMVVGPDAEGSFNELGDGTVELHGFLFPRPEELADWVEARSVGPRYDGDMFAPNGGEKVRHRVVPPNSDVAWDMLTSPVTYLEGAREMKEQQRLEDAWWLRGVKPRG